MQQAYRWKSNDLCNNVPAQQASLRLARLGHAREVARSAAKGRGSRVAFLLVPFVWRSKEKELAPARQAGSEIKASAARKTKSAFQH
jgi:hypothetical protein